MIRRWILGPHKGTIFTDLVKSITAQRAHMNKNNNENENEERSERSEESDNDEDKEIDESDEKACTTVRNTWKSLSPKVTTEKDLIGKFCAIIYETKKKQKLYA